MSSASQNLPGDREPFFRGRGALLHLYAPGVPSCGQDGAVFICVVLTACGIFKELHEKQMSTLSRVPKSVTKVGVGGWVNLLNNAAENLYSYQISSDYSSHLAHCWLYPGAEFLVAIFILQLVSSVSAPLLPQMYTSNDVCLCLNSKMGV